MIIKEKIRIMNNKKGFTLLEILIVIALAGLILTAAFNVFSSGFNSFFIVEDKANIQRNLRFLDNYVSRNIRNAENISIEDSFTSTTLSAGEKIIGIEDSILKYKEKGGSTRNLVDLSKAPNIKFKSEESTGLPGSLIILINGSEEFSEIILNNFETVNDSGKAIIFK